MKLFREYSVSLNGSETLKSIREKINIIYKKIYNVDKNLFDESHSLDSFKYEFKYLFKDNDINYKDIIERVFCHCEIYLKLNYDKIHDIEYYNDDPDSFVYIDKDDICYVTTTLKCIATNYLFSDFFDYVSEKTENHKYQRKTILVVSDKDFIHNVEDIKSYYIDEIDQNIQGNQIEFIYPSWFSKYFNDNYESLNISNWQIGQDIVCPETNWLYAMLYSEMAYFSSISGGLNKYKASKVLPASVKTEYIVSGTESDIKKIESVIVIPTMCINIIKI